MEPRIQYAKTSDGVNIAYFKLGSGPPLLTVHAIPYSHLELEWAHPGYRSWDERLARGTTLVRYDNRGSGLSDRGIESFTLDDLILDIEAVAGRLGLEKLALLGISQGATVATAFAARHPERVNHLLLWCPMDPEGNETDAATRALRETGDPELYTQTVAHSMIAGWDQGEDARKYAQLMREAVDSRALLKGGRSARFPVAHLLSSVTCPTIVMHRRDAQIFPLEGGRRVAAGIPNAELAVFEGIALMPWIGDREAVARTIERFLGIPDQPAAQTPPQPIVPGGFATILFTDVEGSTALTDRLGDDAARELLREHENITRAQLSAHGGSEVKTMGDGFMASFGSPTRALECAVHIQRAFASPSRSEHGIKVRIGLNAGEPIAEDDDLFGTAVIVAARIAAQAKGGEILVSDVVRQLVAGKGFLFNDRGEHALKGFEYPVRVFEVSWRK